MHSHAVEKAFFADNVTPPGFTLLNFAERNVIVISDRNGITNQNIVGMLIQPLPVFPQRQKWFQKQVGNAVQLPIETTAVREALPSTAWMSSLVRKPSTGMPLCDSCAAAGLLPTVTTRTAT